MSALAQLLLWPATIFSLLAVLTWLSLRVTLTVNRWTDSISKYLPRAMLPLERILFSISIATLSGLMLMYPDWSIWQRLTGGSDGEPIGAESQLKSAIALLALLLFAANQLKSIQKDAREAPKYLGVNQLTYEINKSRTKGVLGQPIFYVAVSFLFLLPLIGPALPESPGVSTILGYPLPKYDWNQLSLVLWISSFAAVGCVLMLNVLGTMGESFIAINYPGHVKWRIQSEIVNRSQSEFGKLLSPRRRGGDVDIALRMRSWLRIAESLPVSEKVDYLKLTIGCDSYHDSARKIARKIQRGELRSVRKRFRRLKYGNHSSPYPIGRGVRLMIRINAIARSHIRNRNLERFSKMYDVKYERVKMLLTYLSRGCVENDIQQWVINECLMECEREDALHAHALSYSDEASRQLGQRLFGQYYGPLRQIQFGNQSNEVNGLQRDLRDPPSYAALKVSSYVYNSILEFASGIHPEKRLQLPDRRWEEIVEAADRIKHRETRDLCLKRAVNGMLRQYLACLRDVSQPDRVSSLELSRKIERFAGRSRLVGSDEQCIRQSIEDEAFDLLLAGEADEEPEIELLVQLISPRRLVIAVLYQIFYSRRSHRPVAPIKFVAIFRKLSFNLDAEHMDAKAAAGAIEFLSRSNVSHFVTRLGVEWLFESLTEDFTLSLCSEFLDQVKRGYILDFNLRDFLIWRLVMDSVGFGSYRGDYSVDGCILNAIRSSVPAMREVLDEWRTVDSRSVVDVEVVLLPFENQNPSQPELIDRRGFV